MASLVPFLTFQRGDARKALDHWGAVLPLEVLSEQRHGAEGPGPEGTLQLARVRLAGQEVMVSDSFVEHGFDFTPSTSLFLAAADRAEFDRLAAHLGDGGAWLMPPDDYGFSERFGWCNDRFGVSWQISLG